MPTEERIDAPFEGDERTMLVAWLEYHRATLAVKCDGLTDEQLRARSVSPSTLSLLGLFRHMAGVEYNWFRFWLAGEEPEPPYEGDDDFDGADTAGVSETFDYWRSECEHSREVLARFDSLDEVGAGQKVGAGISVRWTLTHRSEEYARHNGHADLLREAVDGAKGS